MWVQYIELKLTNSCSNIHRFDVLKILMLKFFLHKNRLGKGESSRRGQLFFDSPMYKENFALNTV